MHRISLTLRMTEVVACVAEPVEALSTPLDLLLMITSGKREMRIILRLHY